MVANVVYYGIALECATHYTVMVYTLNEFCAWHIVQIRGCVNMTTLNCPVVSGNIIHRAP